MLACSVGLPTPALAFDPQLGADARATLERAGKYFSSILAVDGAYVWAYSADLKDRKGEDTAGPTTGWVQPPGTPAVGAALLRIYEVTGDSYWLDSARASAKALVDTQLLSGGWNNRIEMGAERAAWCYRASGVTPDACGDLKGNKAKNRTVLDDDNTQSAIRFLMWLDSVEEGQNQSVRDTIDYAFKRLSAMQYPNGSWPAFDRRNPKDLQENLKASIPTEWPRSWVKPEGGVYYILNDNAQRDMVHLYLAAATQYGNEEFLEAAKRAGEFLLDAQLPQPQSGWAQTYNIDMQPIWGRPFEPPSVASRETAGSITALVELYHHTGDERFVNAARTAADWLRAVRLPDGDWARFYELSTNRPLYVDQDKKLTYEPVNLLSNYSLKSQDGIPQALAYLDAVDTGKGTLPLWIAAEDEISGDQLESKVRKLVETAGPDGNWAEKGWIKSDTFVDAAFLISRYLNETSSQVED